MTPKDDGPMPFIAVKDFGPIANAEVELKPLTVLIGANNTGKSYLALAVYALFQAISGTNPRRGLLRPGVSYRRLWSRDGLGQSFKRAVGNLESQFPELLKLWAEETAFMNWPPKIQQWLRNESENWAERLSRDVDYELRRCFGSSMEKMGRRGQHIERGEFAVTLRDKSTGFNWNIVSRNDELVTEKWESAEPQTSKKSNLRELPQPPFDLGDPDDIDFIAQILLMAYSDLLLAGYSSRPHYLPASRTGILQGHKTLASLIVGWASRAWIEPMEVERLPGVITDLLQALLLLGRDGQPSLEMVKIVEFLESDVLGGTVDVERQHEYPDISYTNEAGSFQFHQVSSMVSELAPLALFLKYLVGPGDLFIFEEPESHLDPANQRRVARAIAMMVNAGVRVLVTTHSDLFLNQINNLMQASQLLPDRLQGMEYDMEYGATELLNPSDVAAYVFRPSLDGTQVSPLPVDSEQGISTESFDTVHRALYDEAIKMEHQG